MAVLPIEPPAIIVAGPHDCLPGVLRLSVERSAANLIVSVLNLGHVACTVGGLPTIGFADRQGQRLPIAWHNAFRVGSLYLGHGPAVPPATIPPSERATSTLSLTPPSAGAKRCANRATLTASWSFTLHTRLRFPLCYARDGSTTFDQSWFGQAG